MLKFDSENDFPPAELLAWAKSHGYGNCIYKKVSVRLPTEADGVTYTDFVDESGYVEMMPLEIGNGPAKIRFYVGKIDWPVTGSTRERGFFCWAMTTGI